MKSWITETKESYEWGVADNLQLVCIVYCEAFSWRAMATTSDFVLADVSFRSPQKILVFTVQHKICRIKASPQKKIDFGTTSLATAHVLTAHVHPQFLVLSGGRH